LSFAVPVALTLISFERLGLAWQGRYTLPFAVGLAVVAASALDRRAPELRRLRVLVPVILAGSVLAQTISLVAVRNRQFPGWPDSFTAAPPSIASLVAVGVVAFTLMAVGIRASVVRDDDAEADSPRAALP